MVSLNPFTEAGDPPCLASDALCNDVVLMVRPFSGAGRLFCIGNAVNNATNDPESILAQQFE
jgi:hypothetical protein